MPANPETQAPTKASRKSAKKRAKRNTQQAIETVGTAVQSGTTHPHRKSTVLPAEVQAAQEGTSVKEVKKARRAARAYARHHQAPQEKAAPGVPALAYNKLRKYQLGSLDPHAEDTAKSYDIFINPKTGKPDRFSNYTPVATRVLNALTGHDPYGSTATNLKNVAISTAEMLAGAGTGAALKESRLAKAAENIATAEQAANDPIALAARAADRSEAVAARTSKAAKTAEKARAATKARYAKEARQLRRAKRAKVKTAAAVNPVTGALTPRPLIAAAEGHVDAVTQEPLQTAKTTARALYGAPAAVIGDVSDLAHGRFKEFADSQIAYAKTVAKLFSGDPAQVKDAVENDVGLVPALSVGLVGHAAGQLVHRATGKALDLHLPSVARRKLERDIRIAKEGKTPRDRREARQRIVDNKYGEPLVQRHQARSRTAKRADVVGERERGQLSREMRATGKRHGKVGRRRTIEADVAKADKRKITSHVSDADLIQFVGRHGFTGHTKNLRARMERIRDNLKDPSRPIDPDEIDTRKVIDAALKDPAVVDRIQRILDRFDTMTTGRSAERHSERVGSHQTTPDPTDERARLQPFMQAEDIPTAGERIPPELRDTTRVKPGPRAETRIRRASKNAMKRARRLEDVATELEAQGNKRRANSLRVRAAKNVTRAEKQLDVVDRFRRADNLDMQAAKLRQEGRNGEARALQVQAEKLREAGRADQAARQAEASSEANQRIEQEGFRQPIYFHQEDIAEGPKSPNTGVPARAKKEHLLTGELAKQGRIDESALTLMLNTRKIRADLADRERVRSFVEEEFHPVNGERILTGDEIAAARQRGEIGPGYDAVPIQEFGAAVQRNGPLRAEVEAKQLATKATATGGTTLYGLVSRSAVKELRAQTERNIAVTHVIRNISRIQTTLMLATSPVWFGWQLIATPLTVAARNPNPARWYRVAKKAIDVWRNAPDQQKVDFRAHFAGNPADFLAIGEDLRGLTPDTIRSMSSAADLAFESPMGRAVHAVWENIKAGGPLMSVNRRYEAGWRQIEALLEIDRAYAPRVAPFAGAAIQAFGAITDQLDQIRHLPGHEQQRYLLDHPEQMRFIEKKVDDAYGNWSSLTRAEKKLSSVVVFYPFVRFSLKYLFWSFPKENPLKAALYANLGQQNAQELTQLLGGDPSFFQSFGQTVIHSGDKPQLADLSRTLPGGNALLETLGNQRTDALTALTRPFQPAVGMTLNALEGKDAFGNPKDNASFLQLEGAGAVSLSPLTRGLRDKIIPPSAISQLFRAIDQSDPTGGPLSNNSPLLPDLIDDAKTQREAVHLSELLAKAHGYSSDEKAEIPLHTPARKDMYKRERESIRAWKEIDKMLAQYGIESKAAQRKAKRQHNNRVYDSHDPNSSSSSSSGGLSGGGLSGGGLNGGGLGG